MNSFHRRPGRFSWTLILPALLTSNGWAQGYRIERIASGLNQPTFVTQAPGDPANLLYFTERTLHANPGFGAINAMGSIWRYDVNTRTRTLVRDFSFRQVTNDTGLHAIAFNPDFNNVGTPGYRKMYVSLSESSDTAINRVEEHTIFPNGMAAITRVLLHYANNAENNHTINWIGFDPTATGEARNHLYISTGDGSFGRGYGDGISPGGRPSQNPTDIRGKILRVDVAGPDAYPSDPLKNFAIPSNNPVPVYNLAHPESPLMGKLPGTGAVAPALGEVWITGVRNGYRASFDRATGDFYYGDVGETAREEVNFVKAGSNASGPPIDFGWPQQEGSIDSNVGGAPHTMTNPFTGVTSLGPIHDYPRTVGFAAIGGYVYRGPVSELQGKYLFADFVGTGQLFAADFDRNADPSSFDGTTADVTDVRALWQSLVFDPTDPSYTPNSTTGNSRGLDHIVSFGEDNAGNVYLVDFGNGAGFNGQYPGPGLGEIFRIAPIVPEPDALGLCTVAAIGLLALRTSSSRRRRSLLDLAQKWLAQN